MIMKNNFLAVLTLLLYQIVVTLATKASQCNHLTWPQKPFCIKYPLHWASTTNNVTEIERLLSTGVRINQKTGRGYTGNTPLHIASRYGNVDAVRSLIRNGANSKMRNNNGEFPMERAQLKFCTWNSRNSWCTFGTSDYSATLTLLQYGCESTGCRLGMSCNHDNRCMRQNTHALSHKPQAPSRHNTLGKTRRIRDACGPHTWFWWSDERCQNYPFHWASVAGDNAKVTNYIQDGTEVDLRDGEKYTPLMLAAWAGRAGTVAFLLQHGADTSLTNIRGRSATLLASKNFCRDQYSKGCNLGQVDYDKTLKQLREGCSSLRCATGLSCINGQCKKQEAPTRTYRTQNIHKKCGPHIWADWSDERCENHPFHWAALTGDNDEVTRFLDLRTKVDQRDGDEYQYTPLMHAAWAGHASTVKLLLSYGADPFLTNVRGHTPLDLAKKEFCRDRWRGCKQGDTDYDETIRILRREVELPSEEAAMTKSGKPCVRFKLHGTWYLATSCKCCWNSKSWCATSVTEQGYVKDWDYCNTSYT